MTTLTLYASYDILAHEKHPVYTADRPASDISDTVSVLLPDGWDVSKNNADETLIVMPSGATYRSCEIIANHGDKPCLCWYEGLGKQSLLLETR